MRAREREGEEMKTERMKYRGKLQQQGAWSRWNRDIRWKEILKKGKADGEPDGEPSETVVGTCGRGHKKEQLTMEWPAVLSCWWYAVASGGMVIRRSYRT